MNKEMGLYISLAESVENIIADMSNYHFKLQNYLKLERVTFLDIGPDMEYGFYDVMHRSLSIDSDKSSLSDPELAAPTPLLIFNTIEKFVKEKNIERLVIDSLSSIRFSSENFAQEDKDINRFVRNLKRLGTTTILISELTNPNSYTTEQFAAHGVIFLHHFMSESTQSMMRSIQIVKMRGTRHDSNMRKLTFSPDGLEVGDVLTG